MCPCCSLVFIISRRLCRQLCNEPIQIKALRTWLNNTFNSHWGCVTQAVDVCSLKMARGVTQSQRWRFYYQIIVYDSLFAAQVQTTLHLRCKTFYFNFESCWNRQELWHSICCLVHCKSNPFWSISSNQYIPSVGCIWEASRVWRHLFLQKRSRLVSLLLTPYIQKIWIEERAWKSSFTRTIPVLMIFSEQSGQ